MGDERDERDPYARGVRRLGPGEPRPDRGFAGVDELLDAGAGGPVSHRDWSRAMFSAEVNFASDVLGSGSEFTVIQGASREFLGQ